MPATRDEVFRWLEAAFEGLRCQLRVLSETLTHQQAVLGAIVDAQRDTPTVDALVEALRREFAAAMAGVPGGVAPAGVAAAGMVAPAAGVPGAAPQVSWDHTEGEIEKIRQRLRALTPLVFPTASAEVG